MLPESYMKYVFVFLLGLVVTFLLTPLVIRLARRIGMMDAPDERRIHTGIIPRGGGLAVFIGFHVACAAVYFVPWTPFVTTMEVSWWLKFLPPSVFLVVVGVADDRWGMQPRVKLGCQIVAALGLYAGGVHLGHLLYFPLPWPVDCFLTVLWCVGFMNAFNLIDGLDGLAAGLGIITAAGVAGSMLIRHLPGDALVLLGLMGACLGFLRYNFNPARVFLGDTGSMFIGFTLAAISLSTGSKGATVASMAIPLMAAGVPILDTALAIWRRSVRRLRQSRGGAGGGAVFSADKDHLHHRLLRTWKSHRRVAVILYAINGGLVGIGLLSLAFHDFAVAIYLAAFIAAVYVMVRHLAYVELWDSGVAVARGLRRPPPRAVAVMSYPVADLAVLALALLASIYLTSPLAHGSLAQVWRGYSLGWLTPPFLCLIVSRTYSRVWSRARPVEYLVVALALGAGVVLAAVFNVLVVRDLTRLQLGGACLFAGAAIFGVIGVRMFPRLVQDALPLLLRRQNIVGVPKVPALVYGAGYSFALFMRAKAHAVGDQEKHRIVMGVLDDDSNLHGRIVYGCRVLGGIEKLEESILKHGIQELVITTFLEQPVMQEVERCAGKYKVHIFRWRTDIWSQQLAGFHFSFNHCLRDITSRLLAATPESLEGDIGHILHLSAAFAESDTCCVVLFAPGTETLDRSFLWSAEGSPLRKDAAARMKTFSFPYLAGQLRQQKSVVISDVDRLPPDADAEKVLLQSLGVRSAVVVPIGHCGRLLGFAGYFGGQPGVLWQEQSVNLLKLQADVLALTLRNLTFSLPPLI
jgi:UDP-N-acetylmuramyl pentapeptide phosphotransferase/UDP-N-acetylglucosamine-1-phosphate transferase